MFKEIELLGKRVTYCRLKANHQTGKVERHEGVGTIVKIFLNEDRRPQVGVLDGEATYSIDLPAINTTEAGKEKYFEHVNAVYDRAAAINNEIKERTATGNAEIERMNIEYLGQPIKMEAGEANDNAPATPVKQ